VSKDVKKNEETEGFLSTFFKFPENGTNLRTEIVAGITTFLTMSYIIIVNPLVVSSTGMPIPAVMIATCLSAAFATLMMGLTANYPFALAPGMGLNAYFAMVVTMNPDITWETALGAVFISGIVFIILSLIKFREMIIEAVPQCMKDAIPAGIGLFIAIIGFKNAGIVEIVGSGQDAVLTLGSFGDKATLLAGIGLLITSILLALKVRGAILLGILLTTVIGGLPLFGLTQWSGKLVEMPAFSDWFQIVGKMDVAGALSLGLFSVIFVFLMVDMFDTIGTLIGVAGQGGFLKDGKLERATPALLSDAVGTVVGAFFGTPTVTSYIESASGVAAGGRTGFTAVVVSILFLISLFFGPLVGMIPGAATAPALIIVGAMMMASVKRVDWSDFGQSIPAFLTIALMPFTSSIANGIAFGFIAYSVIQVFAGKAKNVHWLTYIIAATFIAKFILQARGYLVI
jgi:AGZA family xanthine/uracil permease-like MFS transporter